MYASLKEVASRAGVSFQTASKVLTGRPVAVSTATRERIEQAAEELGYVPNAVARSLVTARTSAVGVVVGDLSDWVHNQFVIGAEEELRGRGYAVLMASAPSRDRCRDAVRSLLEHRVGGILATASALETSRTAARLVGDRVPAVSIHRVPGAAWPLVGSDHRQAGTMAARHLLSLGHRDVGSVTGPESRRVTASRRGGWQATLAAAGVDAGAEAQADWSVEGAYQATAALLAHRPSLTALFVHSDLMAVGVLSALGDAGRRVPDDVAVVSCDDIPLAAHTIPPLTTVRVPFRDTGRRAAALLLGLLDGAAPPDSPVLLPVDLVRRRSCGASAPPSPRPPNPQEEP